MSIPLVHLTDLEQPVDRAEAFRFSGVYPSALPSFTVSLADFFKGETAAVELLSSPLFLGHE
jgi:hypothetical protein